MPFTFDLLDQQKKKQQDPNAPQGAPAMTGGGLSFGGGAGAPTTAQPKQQGAQKQGSGFVGLDKYMTANQGNNFGQQFTGKVENQVNQGQQALQQGAQSFTNASNQGAVKDASKAKDIITNAGDGLAQGDIDTVKNTANARYQGPENFLSTDWGQQAQGNVQKAASQGKALQSEGGRFALLDQYYGRPQYSQGQKSLDNLLVQNDKRTAARSQALGGQAQKLSSDADDQNMQLDNLASQNKSVTAQTAKDTRDYLGQAKTGFQTDLQKRYDDYLSDTRAYNSARSSDLGDDNLDSSTLGMTGLKEGDNLYGLNLSDYIQNSPEASRGQFASDKDYARYLALSKLSGENPTLLNPSDRSKAGSGASMGRMGYDSGGLSGELSSRKKEYQEGIDPQNQAISHSDQVLQAAKSMEERGQFLQAQQLYGQASKERGDAEAEIARLNDLYKINRKVGKA